MLITYTLSLTGLIPASGSQQSVVCSYYVGNDTGIHLRKIHVQIKRWRIPFVSFYKPDIYRHNNNDNEKLPF